MLKSCFLQFKDRFNPLILFVFLFFIKGFVPTAWGQSFPSPRGTLMELPLPPRPYPQQPVCPPEKPVAARPKSPKTKTADPRLSLGKIKLNSKDRVYELYVNKDATTLSRLIVKNNGNPVNLEKIEIVYSNDRGEVLGGALLNESRKVQDFQLPDLGRPDERQSSRRSVLLRVIRITLRAYEQDFTREQSLSFSAMP